MLCFPSREDIPLRRSPLKEVICQVRFPALLRLANEQPIDFQERIRKQFPQLEVEHGIALRIGPLDEEVASPPARPSIFRFRTSDGATTASLAADFYALSTVAYTHWPDFLAQLELVTEAARSVYEIPYATRVGLRYINHITPRNTGLCDVAALWSVVRPEFSALLRVDCWDEPIEMFSQLVLAGEGSDRLTLRSGFQRSEPLFLLDLDYYVEEHVPLDELSSLVQGYHDLIYDAFRWCIPEGNLAVFEPVLAQEGG